MELQNIIELTYSSIIVLSCLFIYLKTKKLYDLTNHKGIKAFRDAFFYWGIAFLVRMLVFLYPSIPSKFTISIFTGLIFLYGLSMAGFSLVYSLVWKNLVQGRKYLLHIAAVAIAVLNLFYVSNLMYYTQFAVLLYGISISHSNYKRYGEKHKFLQLYLIGLILAFIGYFVNFLSDLILPYFEYVIFYSYAVTVFVFLIFVYGVYKTIKNE